MCRPRHRPTITSRIIIRIRILITATTATHRCRYPLVGVGVGAVAGMVDGAAVGTAEGDGMAAEGGTEAAAGMVAIANATTGSSRSDFRVKTADQSFLPNTFPSSSRIEPSGKTVTGKI